MRRVVSLAPALAAAHSNLGQVLLVANEPDAAEAAYLRASELEPDSAAPLAALCSLHLRLVRR